MKDPLRRFAQWCLENPPKGTRIRWQAGAVFVVVDYDHPSDGSMAEALLMVRRPRLGAAFMTPTQEAEAEQEARTIAGQLQDPLACLALATAP